MKDKQKAIVGLGLAYDVISDEFYHLDGTLIELSDQELQDGINSYQQKQSLRQLKIFDYIGKELNPLITDFSIVGLEKSAPKYKQGRKVKSEYRCVTSGELVVSKNFVDILDDNGIIIALQVQFIWYDKEGNLALTKTENVKYFNKAEAEFMVRKRRERSIDFLVSEGKNTPIEPVMNAMFEHYYDQVSLYRQSGSDALKDAILSETDPTMLHYLGLRVPLSIDPENLTVPIKESILHQIFAINDDELAAVIMPV